MCGTYTYIYIYLYIHMPTFAVTMTHMWATIVYMECMGSITFMSNIFQCILYPHVGWLYPHDIPEFDGAYNRLGNAWNLFYTHLIDRF